MLTFAPDTYILAVWFVGHDEDLPVEDRVDWLAYVQRPRAGGDWALTHRFRYHNSPGLDADDHKSTHTLRIASRAPEEVLLAAGDQAAAMMAARNHTVGERVLLQRAGPDALTRMLALKLEWFHVDVRRAGAVPAQPDGLAEVPRAPSI